MKNKKIVIVSSLPLSESACRNRILTFIDLLSNEKGIVVLICPKGGNEAYVLPNNVKLIEVDLKIKKPKSFVKRAFREAIGVATLLKRARLEKGNAYLVTIPSMFLAFLAPLYLFGKTVFLDIRDLTWEYLSEDIFHQRISKRTFRFFFNITVDFFYLISVTNKTEFLYVKKRLKGCVEPLHISNGVSLSQYNKLIGVLPFNGSKYTVTYVGNIGIAQDLSTLVEAAQDLPNVRFKIIGTGIEYEKIKKMVFSTGVSNVDVIGKVPWEDLKKYYNETNILYAQLAPDFSGAMPSKLYEYLATGKYIIYGGDGQAAEILGDFSNNKVIPPCDKTKLVEEIEYAINNFLGISLSEENRELIRKKYIRELESKKLVKEINRFFDSTTVS